MRKQMRFLYLLVAVISFGVGGVIAVIGNNADNPFLIVVGFAGLASGVLLLKKWRDMKESRVLGKVVGKPNCLTISKSHIDFAHLEEDKLLGLSQKCYNDGKYYHIHRVEEKPNPSQEELLEQLEGIAQEPELVGERLRDIVGKNDGEGMSHFELPDDDENERFYDPAEMANVVTMPSNKKYFAWSASLMQTIKIGLMALVIAGEVIGLVAMGG